MEGVVFLKQILWLSITKMCLIKNYLKKTVWNNKYRQVRVSVILKWTQLMKRIEN